jgi:maltoporin
VNAAYDHLWTPQLRTSVYGSWLQNKYSDAANLALCSAQTNLLGGAITFGAAGLPGTSAIGACNNNWNLWTLGSRTQYNFTPWFYVGFDVIYSKIETASNGAIVTYTQLAGTAKPTALYGITNQDNYGLRIRVHRDIVP